MDTSLETKAMDEERKSLETLFTARFNAYLVSVGLFSVASTSPSLTPAARTSFWLIGAIVSSVMFLSLRRTYILADRALNIVHTDPNHPYSIVIKGGPIFPPIRVNKLMLFVPAIVTIVFFIQFVISVTCLCDSDP
jgi:hypothetical protein